MDKPSHLSLPQAKAFEQRVIAAAFRRILNEYPHQGDALALAIRALPEHPKASQVASILHRLRLELHKGSSPFLGDCALTVFVGADLSEPLQNVVRSLPQPQTTLDLFGLTRRLAARSHRPVSHYLRHPRILWGMITGSALGSTLLGRWFPFDPKGFGRNASGRLFSERFVDHHAQELDIDWTVGPTPTLGMHAAPETVAAVEAMEHRSSRCYPHTMWIYVNLQSMDHVAEGRRSRALLDLSARHPSVFRMASISVDAPFYLGRERGLTTLQAHKERLIGELRKGKWYAFSLGRGEEEAWWRCTDLVVDNAYAMAAPTEQQAEVFHELVVVGLVRAWQGFCCRHASGMVMSTIACRECVDRGGSVNSAFVWALTEAEENRALSVMSVLWGRPLLSRHRLIFASRTRGFEALVRSLSPEAVRNYLDEAWTIGCCGHWMRSRCDEMFR
jgi:hypothetical protein